MIRKRVMTLAGGTLAATMFLGLSSGVSAASALDGVGQAVDVVCTYAPSQSRVLAAMGSGFVGGVGAASGAVAQALGWNAVLHSSGAWILTGSTGYVPETLGAIGSLVATAPVVVAVSVAVGGSVVTLELVCASRRHPDQVAKIYEAAREFSRRFKPALEKAHGSTALAIQSVRPVVGEGAARVRSATQDALQYAYRKSVSAGQFWADKRKAFANHPAPE